MTDLTPLGIVYESKGAAEAERVLEQLPGKAAAAERATDSLGAAAGGLSREMLAALRAIEAAIQGQTDFIRGMAEGAAAALNEAAAMGSLGKAANDAAGDLGRAAGAAKQYDAATAASVTGVTNLSRVHVQAAGSSKVLTAATLNLSRQLTDVGVSAAMGINPLMILIQQGPQIADAFAMAKTQGLGFSAVLRGMWAGIAPIVAALAPIAGLAAAAAGGFLLMNREFGKTDSKDFAAGLGLTEKQLERVKDRTITLGDTWKATINVMGKYLSSGPLGDALDWMKAKINEALDFIAKNFVKGAAIIAGSMIGVIKTIEYNWRSFPAVVGDAIAAAVNLFIAGAQKMINAAVRGMNTVLQGAALLNPALGFLKIPDADLSGFKMQVSGAAKFVGTALTENVKQSIKDAGSALSGLFKEIGVEREKVATERIKKEAGKAAEAAGKKAGAGSTATPRDQTDERVAQIQQLLAQAMADELEAQRATTKDVSQRARIEKEILAQQLEAKNAQLNRIAASIMDDKGLSEQKKKELVAQLEIVKATNERAAALRGQAITDQALQEISRQQLEARLAQRQNEIDILNSQGALARTEAERTAIGLRILDIQQQSERDELAARTVANGYTKEQEKQARDRLAALEIIQANEKKAAYNMNVAYDQVAGALGDMKSAFKQHDWARVFDGLNSAVKALQLALQQGGDSILGAISGLGSLIGGKFGRALSGLSSALNLGNTLGGLFKIGGAANGIGSLLGGGGGISSLLGGGGGLGGLLSGVGSLFGGGGGAASVLGAAAGAGGGLGGLLGGLGGALASNPVGWIIGGGLLLGSLFGNKKPSNAGAGYDLVSGQFSGKSRTSETEGFVKQAGDTIKEAQESFKKLGLTLNETINGLVIGTRDLSQIYTSSGKTLTSKVGDAADAAQVALKAVLQGASYVNDAQKKMVDDMLAAGKSVEDITQALQDWQTKLGEAQAFGQGIQDQILKLTDPRAYDLTMLQRAQDSRTKQLSDYLSGGFIDQATFNDLSSQLKTLNDLELADTLKKYNEAAMQAANDVVNAAQQAVGKWEDIANSLADYRRKLAGEQAGATSAAATLAQARSAFQALAPLVRAGNVDALQRLSSAGDSYIEAARAAAPDRMSLARVISEVQGLAGEGEAFARGQSGEIYREIADNTAQLVARIDNLTTQLIAANQTIIEQQKTIAEASAKTAKILVNVTEDGDSLKTTAAAA